MAINALTISQDSQNPQKKWVYVQNAQGGDPMQFTLTDQQFQAFQQAGVKAVREDNNPLYYNKGAFDANAQKLLTPWLAPLPAGIGNRMGGVAGNVAGYSDQQQIDYNTALNKVFSTDFTKLAGASLADPYADKTLWAKTPYMGGSQVSYIGPKGGPQDPDKAGLSNVQAPAMTQAGSSIGNASIPTATTINQGLQDFLKRIQTEGIGKPGDTNYLAPNRLTTSNGQINPVITAEGLQGGGSTKAIDVSGTTNPSTTGTDATSMFAGAEEWIKQWEKLNASADATGQSKVDSMLADIENKYGELLGKGNAQAEAEKQAGIDTMKKNIADINAQIYTKLAEAKARQAEYAKLNTSIEGKSITMNSIIGSQAQVNKMALAEQNSAAADIGILQSQVQAMTGQLGVAQDTINRAIDLKYQGILDDISVRKAQIDIIQGQLDKKDKAKADAISAYLDSQKTAVNDAKKTEQQLVNYNLDAMSKYPSAQIGINDPYQTTQNKILNSKEYKLATTPTPTDTNSKEFTRVKAIVASHPNEWGNAADQIDAEFGKGTATKYDDYLKGVYTKGTSTNTSTNGALDFSNL